MEVRYPVGKAWISASFDREEGWNALENVMLSVGQFNEVFKHRKCGKCGCDEVVPMGRRMEGDRGSWTALSMKCQNPQCRASLSFGRSSRDDSIYAKLKDKDGNVLADGGWVIYQRKQSYGQQHSAPVTTGAPAGGEIDF